MAAHEPDGPFVGRERELAVLHEALQSARSGRFGAVLLGGDAGIGKSRLTRALCEQAEASGDLVLLGHCVDLGSGGVPYLPFAEALTRVTRAGSEERAGAVQQQAAAIVRKAVSQRPVLARLVGRGAAPQVVGQVADDALDRLPLLDAVWTLLADLAAGAAPVVLVLEDVHWADAATRDLLRYLLIRLGTERILVVATYRSDDLHRRHPLRPLLAELLRLRGVQRCDLTGLTKQEVGRLLELRAGAPVPDDVVSAIASRSEGNAFFAEELFEARCACEDENLPTTLSDVLLSRIERLPPQVQALARVAAVGGRRVPDVLLRAVASDVPDVPASPAHGLPAGEIDGALREAVAHLVLVADDRDGYSFRHALVQEAVYADLLPGERVRLHATYARHLTRLALPGTAADLARHCLASHDVPGALSASLLAAEEAGQRLAPAEALRHEEMALQLLDAVPSDQRPADAEPVRLSLRAAASASAAGQHPRAAALAKAALDAARTAGDRPGCATAGWRLAHHLYALGKFEAARDEARQAAGVDPGSASAVWAAAVEVRALTMLGQTQAATAVLRDALATARSIDLPAAEADLLVSQAVLDRAAGPQSVRQWLERAQGRASQGGDSATALRAAYNLGVSALQDGRLEDARQGLEAALRLARDTGLTSSLYGAETWFLLAATRTALGEWDEAVAFVERAGGVLPYPVVQGLQVVAAVVEAQRDPAAALTRLAGVDRDDPEVSGVGPLLDATRAEALLWCGRAPEAGDVARGGLAEVLAGPPDSHPSGIRLAALALAAAAAQATDPATPSQRRRELLAEASQVLAIADACATPRPPVHAPLGPEGLAWLARARAEAADLWVVSGAVPEAQGRQEAAEAWSEVASAFSYGEVFRRAEARYRLARALLLCPDERRAARDKAGLAGPSPTELARQAREVAVRLRAQPLRQAIDAMAARWRLDLGTGVVAAPALLTPREAQVIALVAEGLTNREVGERLYISEKTASVHVSNVLAKLGATKRAEAVAIASRRGLLDR